MTLRHLMTRIEELFEWRRATMQHCDWSY